MATKPFQPPKLMAARPRVSTALQAPVNLQQFMRPNVPQAPTATKLKKKLDAVKKSSLGPGLMGMF